MIVAEFMNAVMQECRKARTQEPHPRFSNALGCLRSHCYDLRLLDAGEWPAEIDKPARWNFAAAVGNALGDKIEAAAVRLGAQVQQPVALGDISGTLDIEIEDCVLDIKWAGEYAYRQAKKGPDPKHSCQCNAYAVARGKPKWALVYLPIHMLGKGENLEMVIHEGVADAERAQREVTDRWAEVERHRQAGTLPAREIDRDTCFRLKCMHRNYCWETT